MKDSETTINPALYPAICCDITNYSAIHSFVTLLINALTNQYIEPMKPKIIPD